MTAMLSVYAPDPAPRLTDVLREEHVEILRALTVAEALVGRVDEGRPLDRAALGRLVAFLRSFADRRHHRKEEELLFPAMARYGVPLDAGPIAVMLGEHEEGRKLIAAMAAPDEADVVAAVSLYVRLLRAHIAKENDVLFRIADSVLPDDEQQRLTREFAVMERDEIGSGEHDRLVGELGRLEGLTRTAS